MENMNIIIPKAIDNLQLPDPELRNFYVDLDHRAFWVDDEITQYSLELVKYIMRWNREDANIPVEERKPIKLFFFSPGGGLDEQASISNIITLSKTPVYGYNMGMTASAAAYIFLSCHKRFMLKDSYFLFHIGSIGMQGNATDVLALIEDYQNQLQFLVDKIVEKTNFSQEEVAENIMQDWYVRADLALEKGVVDKVIDDIEELI